MIAILSKHGAALVCRRVHSKQDYFAVGKCCVVNCIKHFRRGLRGDDLMRNDDLDRILCEEEILPSSGFVGSVMEAVQGELEAPPIPFPWKRALPGLALACLLIFPVLIMSLQGSATATWSFTAELPILRLGTAMFTALSWVIFALT